MSNIQRKTTRLVPVVGTGVAYTGEDQLGALMQLNTFEGAGPIESVIEGVTVIDIDAQTPQLVLYFFKASVTLAADNAPFTLSDADGVQLIAQVPHTDMVNNSAGSVQIQSYNFQKWPKGVPLFGASPIYVGIKVVNTPTFSTAIPLYIDVHCIRG